MYAQSLEQSTLYRGIESMPITSDTILLAMKREVNKYLEQHPHIPARKRARLLKHPWTLNKVPRLRFIYAPSPYYTLHKSKSKCPRTLYVRRSRCEIEKYLPKLREVVLDRAY